MKIIKTIIINYFATLGSFIGFVIFLVNDNIPASVLMCMIFILCMVWFTDITKRWAERIKERQIEPKEEPWNNCRIDIPLDEPIEKKSNIRTGSYPSEQYFKMVKERDNDTRRENPISANV